MAGEDKRIRELTAQVAPLLNDFLAIDRNGWSSAMRITLQQIIDLAASSAPFSKSYSGISNPDNAFGNNGDSFFVIPEDQTGLKLFQKIDNAWVLIFQLTFAASGSAGSPTTGTLQPSDEPLVITWDTDPVPGDGEGRTYLEKHGPLEKVSIQVAMPKPEKPGSNGEFPNWDFDEATKNILTIDNQYQKLYYVIGFGADGSSGGGGTGDLTNANFVDNEEPAGDIDGTNVTYTLAFSPVAGSVKLYLNGARQRAGAGNDYTISGSTITMLTPILTGGILIADYRK